MDPIVSPTGQRVLSHPGKYRHLDYACSQVCFVCVCACACFSPSAGTCVFVCKCTLCVNVCLCRRITTATALFGCSFLGSV